MITREHSTLVSRRINWQSHDKKEKKTNKPIANTLHIKLQIEQHEHHWHQESKYFINVDHVFGLTFI